jgi:hypothetical protein
MSVVVPEPVPLDMPPGDPAALEDFVEDVAGTGYRLAVVATCLSSSSAQAPNWRGADAAAAGGQVAVVARLADDLSGAVATAAGRLRAHHDHVLLVRRRIAALRRQQEEDFAAARARLREIPDFLTGVRPEAAAVTGELAGVEAVRRREYDRLLAELADDAAAAARVLADACRPVGGTGRPGDSALVVAHLAAQLPGWGEPELARRGGDLARALLDTVFPTDREAAAREAAAYAGSRAFAGTFLAGLGESGVLELLTVLGDGDFDPASALARVLGTALGAAEPTGGDADVVDAVLTATYIDPDAVTTNPDLVALGMGVVLRASGTAGPRSETITAWGRQLLDRERVQSQGLTGSRAVDRAAPIGEAHDPTDPMGIVLERLTSGEDPRFAAEFLSERSTWDVLLSRPWDDGGAAFSRLVDHAGTEDGPVGGDAARSGLEALGAGLEDGNPDEWTVDRDTAAAVAESLGRAVAAHAPLIAGALERAADGHVGPRDGDTIRGLGYLTLDESAARTVQAGLEGWVDARWDALGAAGPAQVVAVQAAFVGVREYGQRLAYALHGFEQKAAAELSAQRWEATWGLLPNLLRRMGPGALAGMASDYVAIALDRDGTWDNGPDDGRVFDASDAERAAAGSLPAWSAADVAVIGARAGTAFENTLDALGRPKPPTSPPSDLWKPVKDAGLGFLAGRAGEAVVGSVGRSLDGPLPPGLVEAARN